MPVTPTYPGVYIEEVSSGVRTITGVSTSVAAFVDYFSQGLLNKPVQCFNFGDFERAFGGLNDKSEASYAIQQFFSNGGSEAWVVRVGSGGVAAATVEIQSGIGGAPALTLTAGRSDPITKLPIKNPGLWGNNLRVTIDYPTPTSGDRFNLTVFQVDPKDGGQTVVRSETFRELSMNSADLNFVESVVNDEFAGSKLVSVIASGNQRPLQTGTLSGVLPATLTLSAPNPEVTVTIGTEGQGIAKFSAKPTTLEAARAGLESAIRAANPSIKAFSQATVSIVDNRLRILAGPTFSNAKVTFTSSPDPALLTSLGLSSGTNLEGVASGVISGAFPIAAGGKLNVTIGGSGPITLTLAAMTDLAAARTEIESKIRAAAGVPAGDAAAFTSARVIADTDTGGLIVLSGLPGKAITFTPEAADLTVTALKLDASTARVISAFVSANIASVPTVPAGTILNVAIGGLGPFVVTTTANATTLSTIAPQLQVAIRAANSSNAFANARVFEYAGAGNNHIVILSGETGTAVVFSAGNGDTTTVTALGLNAAEANVQRYVLGAGAAITGTAQGSAAPGNDGNLPDGLALIGDLNTKTGIYALEGVDLFNILCIPRVAVLPRTSPTEAAAVIAVMKTAINYCEQRRAFFIVDTPSGINEVQEIKDWLNNSGVPRSKNAALYFPRVQMPDPLNGLKLRSVGASGMIAGLYARTDSDRGVWKAPAGTDATLRNVSKLEAMLTDPENGTLNPLAINCLRTFPVYGSICWGARTLDGADQKASEWKYVPVRRTALFIEETLYRGLKWVVFEPNDEPLWAQIRLNVGAFMNNLFRQGAFQGRTPREAYFVKCDKESTTQNDINLGIVNIIVGFAPLKPAEFVIIKLQQISGQIEV
jgi:uncharacterized protein